MGIKLESEEFRKAYIPHVTEWSTAFQENFTQES
jgi:hypothetical protein